MARMRCYPSRRTGPLRAIEEVSVSRATPINTNVTFPGRPTLCAGGDASVSAGPLDVGTNIITGSTYYSGATGLSTCLFDLTVSNPQVLDITGVRFDVTDVVGRFPDVYVRFFGPGVDMFFYRDYPATWSFDSGPIFLTGLNSLFYDTQSASVTSGGDPYNYLFTLQIDAAARDVTPDAAVPEPITLSLLGTGLAGAVAMRRRKNKAA